jgi:RND family efflux transporter MFP subunit
MREYFYRLDRGHRWGFALAAVFGGVVYASALATAWPDGAGQPADEATKLTRPISSTELFFVKYMEEAVLAFERPGILGAIDVQEGDLVESGRFLAKLKDDVAKAALAVADATTLASEVDIEYSAAAAAVAAKEVERMVAANLKTPRTVPDLEVERTRLTADKTRLEVEKAKHTRDINVLKTKEAAAQLATYQLDAPFDGFVSHVHLTKGASVKQGDQVIKLVSTRKMKVEGKVALRDAALLRPGMKVDVQLLLPEAAGGEAGKSYPGKLVFIDVEATPLSSKTKAGATVRVWAEVENVDNMLRAGLTATMTILPAKSE